MENRRQFLRLSTHSALAVTALGGSVKSNAEPAFKTGLVLDDGFLKHQISVSHPESPARYRAITQHMITHDLAHRTMALTPSVDAEKWLNLVHSQQHIEAIKLQQNVMHNNAILATSGVLTAVDAVCQDKVKNAFCASRPPGHHARNTGKEEGFCYYNHIAIAAKYAQQKYNREKILIIDWDYHHGDGTEWAFYSDPSVLYFSTHDLFAYPGTGFPGNTGEGEGEGFNINVHLDCGSTDKDIIRAFKTKLLPAVETFKPDLILISAGFDSRQHDLLGCFDITDDGFRLLTELVKDMANAHCNGNIISMLEGGYNLNGIANATLTHIETLLS